MKRKMKSRLALAFAALAALSAVAAQPAQAESFHAEEEDAIVTGQADPTEPTQYLAFVNENGEEVLPFECSELALEGTQAGAEEGPSDFAAAEMALHPEFGGCTATLGTVILESGMCHFDLGAETSAEEEGSFGLECPEGEAIRMTLEGGCVVGFGNQIAAGGVHYENVGEKREEQITADIELSEFAYTTNSACEIWGFPASGYATWAGKITLTAYEDLGGTTTAYEMGKQIGLRFG